MDILFIPLHNCTTSSMDYSENIGLLSCGLLPNVDPFHYTISNAAFLNISTNIIWKVFLLWYYQAYDAWHKIFKNLMFASKFKETRGFPGGSSGKESACQCRRGKRLEFHPWVGKIPWRRKWHPTPVFLPEISHGQRSLAGYSPWSFKESFTTECLSTMDPTDCLIQPLQLIDKGCQM